MKQQSQKTLQINPEGRPEYLLAETRRWPFLVNKRVCHQYEHIQLSRDPSAKSLPVLLQSLVLQVLTFVSKLQYRLGLQLMDEYPLIIFLDEATWQSQVGHHPRLA
jgi:hypothetical protein